MFKIAYFCVNLSRGGLERLLLQICSEFKANYPDIHPVVVAFQKKEQDLTPEFINAGISVEFLNISDTDFGLPHFLTIYKWLKRNKPDVVHTHSGYRIDMFILMAAGFAGIRKRFCTIHNMDQPERAKSRVSFKVSSFLSNSVIAVSESAKNFYIENHFYDSKKLRVIYNCPGFKFQEFKPRTEGLSEKSIIKLVNIGSLRFQKGQIFLIRAMKILQSSGLLFQLDIYGADRFGYGDIIFNEISNLGLKMVSYKGETDSVGEILANSDILIASSVREAMPLVVLEGVMAGIPIVATDILPHREILCPITTSILVEPESETAIADGILKLIRQKEHYNRYSEELLNRSKDFSPDITVRKHLDLYMAD